MIPNMPYQKQLSGMPPEVLANSNRMNPLLARQSLPRKTRRQLIGVLFFCFVAFASFVNLNGLLAFRFNLIRVASFFMLAATIATLLIYKLNILRDLGKSGKLFALFYLVFLTISIPVALISSMDKLALYNIGYYFQLYGAAALVLLSSALAARHLVVAYSTKTLVQIIYFIGLIMVGSVFLGVFWKGLYLHHAIFVGERAVGFYLNPNEAGSAVCYFVAICFAYLAAESKTRNKLWILTGIPIAAAGVYFTFSRGAIITFIILCGLQIIWASKKNRKLIFLVGVASMIMMVSYILTKSTISHGGVADQDVRVNKLRQFLSGKVVKASEDRLVVFSYAIKKWMKSPIIGNGIGSGAVNEEIRVGAHNVYIQILVESGVVPFFLLLFFIFMFLIESMKCKDPAVRTLCFGTMVVMVLAGLSTHGIFTQKHHALFLGVCFGALSGVKYLNKKRILPTRAKKLVQT